MEECESATETLLIHYPALLCYNYQCSVVKIFPKMNSGEGIFPVQETEKNKANSSSTFLELLQFGISATAAA